MGYNTRGCSSSYWHSCKSHQEKRSNMLCWSCPLNWLPEANGCEWGKGGLWGKSWQPPGSTSCLTPRNTGSARCWCFSAKLFLNTVTHFGDVYKVGKWQKQQRQPLCQRYYFFLGGIPEPMSGWLKTSPAPLIQDNFEEPSQLHRSAKVSPLLGCNRTAVQLLPPPSPTSLPPSQVSILRTTLINPLQECVPWMQVTNSMTKEWQSLALRGHLSSCTPRLLLQGHRKVRGTFAQLGERCIRIQTRSRNHRGRSFSGKIHIRRRPRQNAACFFQSTLIHSYFSHAPKCFDFYKLHTVNKPVTGVGRILCGVFHLERGRSKMALTHWAPEPNLNAFLLIQPPQVLHASVFCSPKWGDAQTYYRIVQLECVQGHRLLLLLLCLCLKALQATLLYTQCKDYRPKERKEYRRSWEGNSLPFYW